MSSAYVNVRLREADEKIYPAPADVEDLLKLCKELSDEDLVKATPKILDGHANPYTFTKHLAEHEIVNSNLPTTIVRPSMSNYWFYVFQEKNFKSNISKSIMITNFFTSLICSHWCLEGARSRLDDLQKRSPRILDGSKQRCCQTIASRQGTNLRLHSRWHRCEPTHRVCLHCGAWQVKLLST